MIAFTHARSCFLFSLLLIGLARASNDEPPRRPALRNERAALILGGDSSTWSPTPINDDVAGDGDDNYNVDGGNEADNFTDDDTSPSPSVTQAETKSAGNAAYYDIPDDDTSPSPSLTKPETKSVEISSAPSVGPLPQGSDTSSAPSVKETIDSPTEPAGSGTGGAISSAPSKSESVTSAPSKPKHHHQQTAKPTFVPRSPTAHPTKSPTKRPSPMPTTEAWADKVKDEENRIKELADDKTAEVAAGLIFFLGIVGMVFTAYQIIENPDGLCASLCRLSIKFSSFLLKIVCLPCRLCCGKYSGYSTSDPKNRTLFVEEYTNDLELT